MKKELQFILHMTVVGILVFGFLSILAFVLECFHKIPPVSDAQKREQIAESLEDLARFFRASITPTPTIPSPTPTPEERRL